VTSDWSNRGQLSQRPGRAKSPPGAFAGTLDPRSLETPDEFAVVFDRYFAEIHGYVGRRLDTAVADDIAAETFLVAFRKRATFDESAGSVRAWLYGIATRQIGRHRRGEMRAYQALRRLGADREADDATDEVADRVSAGAASRLLAGALAGLPRGDREVLLLVALADLSHAEVAAALGIPYGTVASRLHRARRKLRLALGPLATTEPQE
jgi:RNA polymerase sigma factor (sigma-70 family)